MRAAVRAVLERDALVAVAVDAGSSGCLGALCRLCGGTRFVHRGTLWTRAELGPSLAVAALPDSELHAGPLALLVQHADARATRAADWPRRGGRFEHLVQSTQGQ